MGVIPHPARFPARLPEFFIRFLTDPGDTVLDIFAGSNTTGMVADTEGRHWLAFEERADYLAASAFRFLPKDLSTAELQVIYDRIESGDGDDLIARRSFANDQTKLVARRPTLRTEIRQRLPKRDWPSEFFHSKTPTHSGSP